MVVYKKKNTLRDILELGGEAFSLLKSDPKIADQATKALGSLASTINPSLGDIVARPTVTQFKHLIPDAPVVRYK